ncbi:alpha/beta fold hydrolase [Salinarimonas sp.]|uniref:alpha/beta fold hydrolase n=1 Tax=Salinarimonas sp. TaxID=2766526 RepID=UPI003919B970
MQEEFPGFEGFRLEDMEVPDRGFGAARIRYRIGGAGPPLLLLHGNPMSHVSWHKIAARLAERFSVVASDLRGYGDSIGPEEGGERSINYSFRAMAQDQVDLMEALGFARFQVVGHDRGARTTHRMALDHPARVVRAGLVDILPNRHIWHNASKDWAMKSWHWLFMAQPYDMPERMMAGVPARYYMERKLSKPGLGLSFFHPRAFDEYVRCFTWKTIRGSCEDYRACPTSDLAMDDADFEAGRRVACPLLVIWGARSHTGTVHGDVLACWRPYAGGEVTGGPIPCGHYVQEEAPEETFAALDGFLDPLAPTS